ncbi:DGPFAETKE family protein [Kineococcus radiotolerans SRS30216 = ATCC BAA-149]|uniref:DGPFAETKE family protein n=1 Tax=Kineococcus radiotolerans (strain ATCC BAA-149 / DSM 14245 / SRS30216) TaxID=266940 RepID=A6WBV5_KINRD|nr:DGPFAETKE family protein [Kineococcus radiotolerans SRS30216 = ATCC BAA-149]
MPGHPNRRVPCRSRGWCGSGAVGDRHRAPAARRPADVRTTAWRGSPVQFALIYSYDPSTDGPAEAEVEVDQWLALDAELSAAGVTVHESGFHPVDEAKDVTVRDGRVSITDAPRQGSTVAGLYVVDVPDLDEALRLAAEIPTAAYGTVQVRQVVQFEG